MVLSVAVLAVGLWFYGRRPALHRALTSERIEQLLRVLLLQGYDGGVLRISGATRFPFIQIMKYAGRGRVGLQLDFPNAPWTEGLLPKVAAILREFDSQSTIGAPGYQNELQFITVDFGTDINRAAECIARISRDALSIDLPKEGRAFFRNVSSDPTARIGF